jgi:8-oxo-dGTP pyrophosphatase MutT (NUDIX family)
VWWHGRVEEPQTPFEVGPTGLRPEDLRAWTTTSTSGPVFVHRHRPSLVVDAVVLPDGREQEWVREADERDGVVAPDIVAAICRREDGKVLVAFQWNVGPQAVVAEFPGGGAADSEALDDAVRREVAEETGLWPRSVTLLGSLLVDNRASSRRMHWFLAEDLEPRTLPGDEAEIATAWMDPREVTASIRVGRFTNQSMLAGWTLYNVRPPGD